MKPNPEQDADRAAFEAIYKEYGFGESYANAYPAHCNQSFAFEIFTRGRQSAKADSRAMQDAEIDRLRAAINATIDNCRQFGTTLDSRDIIESAIDDLTEALAAPFRKTGV